MLAVAWIGVHLWLGHRYAAVWMSNVAVWRHASQLAPGTLRPWLNLEKARMGGP